MNKQTFYKDFWFFIYVLFVLNLAACQGNYAKNPNIPNNKITENKEVNTSKEVYLDTLFSYKDTTSEAILLNTFVVQVSNEYNLSIFLEGDSARSENTLIAVGGLDIDSTEYTQIIGFDCLYSPNMFFPFKTKYNNFYVQIIFSKFEGKILELWVGERVFLSDISLASLLKKYK